MGFFNADPKWTTNPFAKPGIDNIENWGKNQHIGIAGRTGRQILKQMSGGDYGGLAGTLLSPIHDQYASEMREAIRSNSMGANAFTQGSQPALMANIEQESRRRMAEGEGMAYGQAIPALYGQAAGVFQNAKNARDQNQFNALDAGLRGRIASSQFYQNPSTLSKIGQFANVAGSIASLI